MCYINKKKQKSEEGSERMKRSETIGYKIRLIHNQIHRTMEFKRKENEDDLTSMQRWTLGFLHEHEGQEIYQREIEAAFSISRATASNMLSVMERKGLIERHSVEHDARLKRLVLTERARMLFAKADRDVMEMEDILVAGMSEEEVEMLIKLLNQILENIGVDQNMTP